MIAQAHVVDLGGAADGCPSPAAVEAELRIIFPSVRLAPGGLRVELSNAESSYRVIAGSTERSFADAAAHCDERARKAAVFVALVLAPPRVNTPPPKIRFETDVRFPSLQLELSGLLESAPGAGKSAPIGGGAEARLYFGARYVGASVGISALSRTTLNFASARAQLWRVPVDASLRGTFRRGRFAGSLEIGLQLTAQITDGLDVAPSAHETRLEVGVRFALRAEYWAWRRIAPFVALQGEWVPLPSNLVLPPAQIVGTTPSFWLGAAAGFSFRLL